MVTMAGNEGDIRNLVTDLLYLEHDAIAAYDSYVERLDDRALSAQIAEFKKDHLQRVSVLNEMARELGIEAPAEGDTREILTTGKIALADIFGDAAILKAMKTNEDDTIAAYERAARHEDAIPQSKAFFMQAHQDELRHQALMADSVGQRASRRCCTLRGSVCECKCRSSARNPSMDKARRISRNVVPHHGDASESVTRTTCFGRNASSPAVCR